MKNLLNEIKINNPLLFDKFEILDNFNKGSDIIRVQNKYGICKVYISNLTKGRMPSIKSAVDKTQYFKNQLIEVSPDITVLSGYMGNNTNIFIQDDYGICLSTPSNLLKGKLPTIISAVNKHDYFLNKLHKVQPDFLKYYKFKTLYETIEINLIISTEFGDCAIDPESLLKGNKSSIRNAVNSTEYAINQFKEKHNDIFDYSLIKYKYKTNLKIKCKKHDFIFPQKYTEHLNSKLCCPKCVNENSKKWQQENAIGWKWKSWIKAALVSKNFESFKVYIIKCWNENEEFYKIGRTFTKLKNRFAGKNLPYHYEIIDVLTFEDGYECCKKETELKNTHKKYKYKPLIKFGGFSECFSQVNSELILN